MLKLSPKVPRHSYKFMQVLNTAPYAKLQRLAKKRGINVQELLRAVTIPEWLESLAKKEDQAAAWLSAYLKEAEALARKHSRTKNRNVRGRRSLGAKNGRDRDKGRRQKIRARPSSTTRP